MPISDLSEKALKDYHDNQGKLLAALRAERDILQKTYEAQVQPLENKSTENLQKITDLNRKIEGHKRTLGALIQKTAAPASITPGAIPPPPPPFGMVPPPPKGMVPPPPPGMVPPPPPALGGRPLAPPSKPAPSTPTVDSRNALLDAIREGKPLRQVPKPVVEKKPVVEEKPVSASVPKKDDDEDWETSAAPTVVEPFDPNAIKNVSLRAINPADRSTSTPIDPAKKRARLEKDIDDRQTSIDNLRKEIKDLKVKTDPAVIEPLKQNSDAQLALIPELKEKEGALADISTQYTASQKAAAAPLAQKPSVSVVTPTPGIPAPPAFPTSGIPVPPPFGKIPPPPGMVPPPSPPSLNGVPLPPPPPFPVGGIKKVTVVPPKEAMPTAVPETTGTALNKTTSTPPPPNHMDALKEKLNAMRKGMTEDEKKTPEKIAADKKAEEKRLEAAAEKERLDKANREQAAIKAAAERKVTLETFPSKLGITLDLSLDANALQTNLDTQAKANQVLQKEQAALSELDKLLKKATDALETLSKKQAEAPTMPAPIVAAAEPIVPVAPTMTHEHASNVLEDAISAFSPTPTENMEPAQPVPEHSEQPIPDNTEQGSPERSKTFHTMFENIRIPEEYKDAEKYLEKKLTVAQKNDVHHSLREEQIKLLQEIKESLSSDDLPAEQENAKIFYDVLKAMRNNLRYEFRWTSLLGISKHSRLEDIITKHMGELESNLDLGSLKEIPPSSTEKLVAAVKQKGLDEVGKKIDQLLEPKSFLKRLISFINTLKDSVDSVMGHKPKN